MAGCSTIEDDAIRATNDDASSCKRSAVQKGYYVDPYIQYFVRSAERRAPEINRGYYARVQAIQILLKQFLQATECNCQVVNLGAGFDTSFWHLQDEGLQAKNFIEVDFSAVTARKAYYIKSRKQLLEKVSSADGEVSFNKTDLHSSNYHLVAADLRNLVEFEKKLVECEIDFELPTVFITECVLVYLDKSKSANLLHWIADKFSHTFFINYEQVNMMDRFGAVMIENLRTRQCILHGVDHCHSLETQEQRFTTAGFDKAEAWDMTTVYHNLPQADVQRIERLEFLDEGELLQQLFQHYCVCWASKNGASQGLESITLAPR